MTDAGRDSERRRAALTKLAASVCFAIVALALSGELTMSASASSPAIKFASWDSSQLCPGYQAGTGAVTAIHGVYDLDSFLRDAIAHEVDPTWSVEGLRANAVAARGVVWRFLFDPEWDEMPCNSIADHYHLSTRQFHGWRPDEMADEADDGNRPSDRVTDTLLEVLVTSSGSPVYYSWGASQQNWLEYTATGTYRQRLVQIAAAQSPYSQYHGLVWGEGEVLDAAHTSLESPYPSMTNGTHVGAYPGSSVPGDSYSSSATPVNTAREAEVYWGLKHMDPAQTSPLGQPGRYMIGAHMGDMIEFPLYIGGSYNQLQLIGIADRPAPVTVNVFVDGYWKARASWTAGSNLRAILTISVPGVTYGAHAVAIQFTNDSYTAGGGYDGDRNLYLDVVGVSQ